MEFRMHPELEETKEEDTQFVAAIMRGESALQGGEFLSNEQVADRLQQFLK